MWPVLPGFIGRPETRRESASRDRTHLLRKELSEDGCAIGDRAARALVLFVENPRCSATQMTIDDLVVQHPRSVLAAMIRDDDLV
jgi:hypothetical protein